MITIPTFQIGKLRPDVPNKSSYHFTKERREVHGLRYLPPPPPADRKGNQTQPLIIPSRYL